MYLQLSLNCLIMLEIFSKRWTSGWSLRVDCAMTRNVDRSNRTTSSASQMEQKFCRFVDSTLTLGINACTMDDQACGGAPPEQSQRASATALCALGGTRERACDVAALSRHAAASPTLYSVSSQMDVQKMVGSSGSDRRRSSVSRSLAICGPAAGASADTALQVSYLRLTPPRVTRL